MMRASWAKRGLRVVEVVGILEGMGQHELRLQLPIERHEAIEMRLVDAERIVADVEEHGLAAEDVSGALGFLLAGGLHLLQRGARLPPELRRFAALSIGEADHHDAIAALGVERDGAAGAPDEIRGMRADDQRGLLYILCHDCLFDRGDSDTRRVPAGGDAAVDVFLLVSTRHGRNGSSSEQVAMRRCRRE